MAGLMINRAWGVSALIKTAVPTIFYRPAIDPVRYLLIFLLRQGCSGHRSAGVNYFPIAIPFLLFLIFIFIALIVLIEVE
ncbi:MAG: hypothetical protein WA228_00045, partial [Desulfobaccales bacterium]